MGAKFYVGRNDFVVYMVREDGRTFYALKGIERDVWEEVTGRYTAETHAGFKRQEISYSESNHSYFQG